MTGGNYWYWSLERQKETKETECLKEECAERKWCEVGGSVSIRVISLGLDDVKENAEPQIEVTLTSYPRFVQFFVPCFSRCVCSSLLMNLTFALPGLRCLFFFLPLWTRQKRESPSSSRPRETTSSLFLCRKFSFEPLSWIYSGGGCVRRVRGPVPDVDTVTRPPVAATGKPNRSITTTKTSSTCWAPLRINWRPSDSADTRWTRPPKPR